MTLSTSFLVSEMQNAIKLEKDRLTKLRENLEKEKERPDTPRTRISRDVDALEVCTPHMNLQNKITTVNNTENEVRIGKTTGRKVVKQNETDEIDSI